MLNMNFNINDIYFHLVGGVLVCDGELVVVTSSRISSNNSCFTASIEYAYTLSVPASSPRPTSAFLFLSFRLKSCLSCVSVTRCITSGALGSDIL